MLYLPKIISEINKNYYEDVTIDKDNSHFNLNDNDRCFLIKKWEVLSYGENNFTQLLNFNDPINFAECIISKTNYLRYKIIQDLELISFCGKSIKNKVNSSGALAKTIIKYSINRIFNKENSKSTYYFEDEFLYKNIKSLKIITFQRDKYIFRSGLNSDRMYFIEDGVVKLIDKFGNPFAPLKKGECFGESSLLRGSKRNNSAISIKETKLTVIDSKIIENELKKENYLVQLVIYAVLRKLELINSMRNPKSIKY